MQTLPTGTVTFLFSDIEGSTRLARDLGAEWPAALARHRELLRTAFAANGGVEAGTEGDSFFVAFPTALGAVRAAADAQRSLAAETWVAGGAIRVRIGLHTTDRAELVDGTYAGVEVHRAARIMGSAHGGQIVMSAATRALLAGSVPDGIALTDLGSHRLKDLEEPESLTQVCVVGLQTEFPPLRSVDAGRTNLPQQATTFIGREEEVSTIRGLLKGNRLVTLTGPGGTGKTRLSLQVAAEEIDSYPDGVYFVALAPIREPELVLPAVGRAMGLADIGSDPIQRLCEHLAGKRVLVVLDNLEQVLDAAPDIGELLTRASDLTVIATSRSPLRLYGEQEFAVPPLPMPERGEVGLDHSIARFAAPALFRERARRVKPDFEITDDNAAAVAEICWRLDGLPLAIELAAARVRILTPQAMVARLSRRLELGAPSRDLPQRQQTLRGAIAWSHDLLDEDERRFFAAFSVFRGGAELDAVEGILAPYAADVLDAVSALVDRSLVRQEELSDGTPRFRMLETIREFAEEQLTEQPELESAVRRAHAEHCLRRMEADAELFFGEEQKAVLDRIEREHDNLRAALAWAAESGDAAVAMRLVAAAWRFWQMRGYLEEAEDRVQRVLALEELERMPKELAAFLEAAGGIAYWTGDLGLAESRYERCLEIQRRIGDDAAIANAIYNLSVSFGRDADPPITLEPERTALVEEGLQIYRRLGDRAGEGRTLWARMDIEILELHSDEAVAIGEECRRIFAEVGNRFMLGWTEYMLGLNEALRRDPAAARAQYLRALELFREANDVSAYALVFDGLAAAAFMDGEREYAMRLAGASNAIQVRGGAYLARLNRRWAGFTPEELIADPELSRAWHEGRALSTGQALELAVAGPQRRPMDEAEVARAATSRAET